MIIEKFICTAERPFTSTNPPPAPFAVMILHPDAHPLVSDVPLGPGTVMMYCPHCGREWEKEMLE